MARDPGSIQPAGTGQTDGGVTAPAPLPGPLFVTGGSGFIGRHFLAALARTDVGQVALLSRQPSPNADSLGRGWQRVTGELTEPASYREAMLPGSTVVHLAAATGNASPVALHHINVEGTRRLLEAAEAAGATRILFVSSIAAGYRDLHHYPYGQTKAEGEALVRTSSLDFTILRPTMVLGHGSPIWDRLRSMAGLPVPVMIGPGRTLVQPVDVRDVARGMVWLLTRNRFAGETLELGGPERLEFAELVRRIRRAMGKPERPLLRVPAGPLRMALGGAALVLGSRVPVSPGQLVPFLEDGTAGSSDLAAQLRDGMLPLDDLLRQLSAGG